MIGITAAMNSGTGLNLLQKALPERYYDVGIAEQHAVLFAAGLALEGMKPVAAIYSTFLQRGYDQIVHDVCLQKLNVVFAMDRAGLVGDDGPTHHGAFDISYLRCLPNMVLMAPRDEAMLVHMLRTALLYDDGPVALRYPRGEAVGVPLPARPEPIEIGRGELLREGERVALLGYGYGVSVALGAAELLARGPRASSPRWRRPLREAARRRAGRAPGGRARPARDGRGERARRRLRLGGARAPRRPRPARRHARAALRPARPLRDARQAGAAARGGRAHTRASPSAWRRPCSSPRWPSSVEERLVLPFELRGFEGSVHVQAGVNDDPHRWGFQFLGLDFGEGSERARGFPVIEATVRFGAEGYSAELGWIQLVAQSTPGKPDVNLLCDAPPNMRSLQMPFMSFGMRPALFDAPADDAEHDLTWRATAFLTHSPDILMSKVIGPVCGFTWGFDRRDGEVTSSPVASAGREDWDGFSSALRPLYPEWTFLDG